MSVQIGLSHLYYALLITDPIGGTPTYATPVRIANAIMANVNPNTNSETLFADDGPSEVATTLGNIDLEINVADLDLDTQAAILGHTISAGVLFRKAADTPPWLAIGFKSLKSNGKYRYTWLAKGKFQLQEQANETKGDTINFQTPTINGSFVKRDSDDEWERHIDEDHIDYVASMGTNWFTSPLQTSDSTPPTVDSFSPLDGAVGVAVDVEPVITFDEPMALSTLTTDNIFLTVVSTGAPVAITLAVDAAREVVTITPDANLTGSTEYRINITTAVKDIYGNALAAHNHAEFTTI
jgi:phi13 family phage major tail protein